MNIRPVERKVEQLNSFIEAVMVIEWLNENHDFKVKLTQEQCADMAIAYAAGPSPEEQSKLRQLITVH